MANGNRSLREEQDRRERAEQEKDVCGRRFAGMDGGDYTCAFRNISGSTTDHWCISKSGVKESINGQDHL